VRLYLLGQSQCAAEALRSPPDPGRDGRVSQRASPAAYEFFSGATRRTGSRHGCRGDAVRKRRRRTAGCSRGSTKWWRGAPGVVGLRRDRRRPGHHGLRRRGPVPLVHPAEPSRFWAPDRATDAVALETLHEVLVTSARLLAPAAPFVSDWIHRALVGASVHLAPFPTDLGRRAPELLQAMPRCGSSPPWRRRPGDQAAPVRQPVPKFRWWFRRPYGARPWQTC